MQWPEKVCAMLGLLTVESDKSDESKSLKKSKSRIKSEKSDLIFYQIFGKKSTSLMEMSWLLSQKGLLRVTIIVPKQIIILKYS